jgi:GDPmannose 4,6-dehydratase
MDLKWRDDGASEHALDRQGRRVVAVDPHYFRPTEVDTLLGDASKAREKLGWAPRTSFSELVAEMVSTDLKVAEGDQLLRRHGHQTVDRRE